MDVFNLGLEDLGLDDPQSTEMVENVRMLNERVDEITKAGMMDREQARRLIEEHAVPINPDRYPLVSFTEQPTRTNVAAALESSGAALSTNIRALIDKAVELFRKIMAWIREKLTALIEHMAGDKDKRTLVLAAAPELVSVLANRTKILETAAAINRWPDERNEKFQKLASTYEERVSALDQQLNGYHLDLMYRGATSTGVFWLASAQNRLVGVISGELRNLEDSLNSQDLKAHSLRWAEQLHGGFDMAWLLQGLRSVNLNDSDGDRFSAIMREVRNQVDHRRREEMGDQGKPANPQEIAAGVQRLGNHFTKDMGWNPQQLIAISKNLESQAGKLMDRAQSLPLDLKIGSVIRDRLNDLSSGLSHYVALMVSQRQALNQISNYLVSYTRALNQFLTEAVKLAGPERQAHQKTADLVKTQQKVEGLYRQMTANGKSSPASS